MEDKDYLLERSLLFKERKEGVIAGNNLFFFSFAIPLW